MRKSNKLQRRLLDPQPLSKPADEKVHLNNEILPVPVVTSTVPLSLEAAGSRITSTTISNASNALMSAMRLRSRLSFETEAVTISDVEPEGSLQNIQIADDFIADFVSLAEETQLYLKNADPIQNLQQLTEITEKATHFQIALHSSSAHSSASTAQYPVHTSVGISPGSFGRDFFGHLSSNSDDTSMRMWASDHIHNGQSSRISAKGYPVTSNSQSDRRPSNHSSLQDCSSNNNNIFQMSMASMADPVIQSDNEPSIKDQINLRGRSMVSLTMHPKTSWNCSFDFEVSEGSVLLKVIPIDGPHGTSDAVIASGALLPPLHSSSRRSQFTIYGTPTMLPRPFQHCFQSRDRPIPHLLHPDVEGPTEEPDAPYTITFTERQYILAEGTSEGPRWTTSLVYIFHEKQDQITLREMIFGKTLLMSAGSNKVCYDGQEIAHMSAIALWLDDESETKSKSMTFFPNLTCKKATPKDMELKIHGLWGSNKASRNPHVLVVKAEPMRRDDESLNVSARPDRQSNVQSGGTFLSKASSTTSQRWRKSGKLKWTIEFTRASDRESFSSHLSDSIPSP